MNRAFVLICTLLAGCAMTPEANQSLERARAAYRQAQAHPDVQARAPVELQVAQRQLTEAERLWNSSGAEPAAVSHLAYLAEQRANIAIQTAEMRRAIHQDIQPPIFCPSSRHRGAGLI